MTNRWMKLCPLCEGHRVTLDPRWAAFAARHNLADCDQMRDCPECEGLGGKISDEGREILELVSVGLFGIM